MVHIQHLSIGILFVDESPVDLMKINLSNYNTIGFFSGLYIRFLLSPVLDWPSTGVCEEAWCGDTFCGSRVYQEHLGAWHFLCEWETVVLPQRYHQQRVHPSAPLWQHNSQYEVCLFCNHDLNNKSRHRPSSTMNKSKVFKGGHFHNFHSCMAEVLYKDFLLTFRQILNHDI